MEPFDGSFMDLLALSDFNLVAAHGGFAPASRASKRSKATLSRHVNELETALGLRLIERGKRSTKLTDAGHSLFLHTRDLLSEIGQVAHSLSGSDTEPHGTLRISVPMVFGHFLLAGIAADFIKAFPRVLLEVSVDNRLSDLVEEGFDLVIRANPQPTDDLVGRCFFRDKMLVVAPPSLPIPGLNDGQMFAPAVVSTGSSDDLTWCCSNGVTSMSITPKPVLRLASMLMIRDAACQGAGAALLPMSVIDAELKSGELVCWGESAEPEVEIWVLHTSRRLASKKVQAFVNFLAERFS